MIGMMKNLITTNVRLSQDDMMMAKEMANEMGLSFNGYINWLIKDVSKSRAIVGDRVKAKKNKLLVNMAKDARKIKSIPDDGFSEDDRIIYGL